MSSTVLVSRGAIERVLIPGRGSDCALCFDKAERGHIKVTKTDSRGTFLFSGGDPIKLTGADVIALGEALIEFGKQEDGE